MSNYNMPIGKTALTLKACPTLSAMRRSFLISLKVHFLATKTFIFHVFA